MTKNEKELIEDWIIYHTHLFGIDNIHILDGSDDEEVLKVYERFIIKGLNVRFSEANLNTLSTELTDLMHEHKGTGNFLIKLDTDEFLAFTDEADMRPHSYRSKKFREEFLRKYDGNAVLKTSGILDYVYDLYFRSKNVHLRGIENFFTELPVTGQRYKASLTMWSIPNDGYSCRPCYDILRFTSPQFTHLKSFFHSDSFISVDLGCHAGVSTNNIGYIDTGLTIIHYHSTSVEDTMRRARQALRSHSYILETDSLDEELKKLSALEGKKISSFHKINQYLEYLRAEFSEKVLSPEKLNPYHPYFRKGKTRRMTLVKDILSSIGNKAYTKFSHD